MTAKNVSGRRSAFRTALPALALAAALGAASARAVPPAEPVPEVQRPVGAPQATGVAHTLRQIPEACMRLEGAFQADPARPYRIAAVPAPNCRPRARFVDAAQARPSPDTGWILNDVIRVPRADCADQRAVVRVWRKPAEGRPIELDAQGRMRIYLDDARKQAEAGKVPDPAMYAAEMELQGEGCR